MIYIMCKNRMAEKSYKDFVSDKRKHKRKIKQYGKQKDNNILCEIVRNSIIFLTSYFIRKAKGQNKIKI